MLFVFLRNPYNGGIDDVHKKTAPGSCRNCAQLGLSPSEITARHPAFNGAHDNGRLAGALKVDGFTLNIHDFMANLIGYLEAHGVTFQWSERVEEILRTDDGLISGVRTAKAIKQAHHYVMSPGAYGKESLRGTQLEDKIQGVLGVWLTLPNLNPMLKHSVKIHREGHVGEDSNVTIAHNERNQPTLLLGSGYGFVGSGELEMDTPEMDCLFDAVTLTARDFFPQQYQHAMQNGGLAYSKKACIRPFTCSGLSAFDISKTTQGGCMVITTGHNTGGFTQAPVVAEAVTATLLGQRHEMQAKFHPERGWV